MVCNEQTLSLVDWDWYGLSRSGGGFVELDGDAYRPHGNNLEMTGLGWDSWIR